MYVYPGVYRWNWVQKPGKVRGGLRGSGWRFLCHVIDDEDGNQRGSFFNIKLTPQ
jgi:hypothetical protein